MKNLNLKINETITVLLPNELVPLKITGKLKGYYYNKFAQHENALYLFIQRPRRKKLDRIIISTDTAFILKGQLKEMFRRELVSQNESVAMANLHRLTYDDFKDDENLLYYHEYNEKFNVNDDIEYFADCTCDFMIDNNIRHFEAEENEQYINYIKDIISTYNIGKVLNYCKIEGYNVLMNCINKAICYNW